MCLRHGPLSSTSTRSFLQRRNFTICRTDTPQRRTLLRTTTSLSASDVRFPVTQSEMQTSSVWPLLVIFLAMHSFAFGQGTRSTKPADGSLLRPSVADLCDSFVENNALIVTARIEREINALKTSFQALVDCLHPGGTIRFKTRSFSPSKTIRIEKSITVSTVAEEKIAIACNGRPVFDIRSNLFRRRLS